MITSLSLLCSLSMALLAAAEPNKSAGPSIDGVWIPVACELAGTKMPDEFLKTFKLTLSPGKYLVTNAAGPDEGDCTIDWEKHTLRIDGTSGPNKGKTMLAIFDQPEGKLRICYDLSGKEYPHEFKTTAGTKLFLVEYKPAETK